MFDAEDTNNQLFLTRTFQALVSIRAGSWSCWRKDPAEGANCCRSWTALKPASVRRCRLFRRFGWFQKGNLGWERSIALIPPALTSLVHG
jgi:hypothetical protein